MIPSAALALLSACTTSSYQGRTPDPYNYIPPLGYAECRILGGTEHGRIVEEYSDYGGVVVFWDSGFSYRLDIHKIGDSSALNLRSDIKHVDYFHKNAIPHLLQAVPGGVLIEERFLTIEEDKVYYGVLLYEGKKKLLVGEYKPTYSGIVVHIEGGFAYTVSKHWPAELTTNTGESVDRLPEMEGVVRGAFRNCRFRSKSQHLERITQLDAPPPVYPVAEILITDSNRGFRHITWLGENYGPLAFVSAARRAKVERVVLGNRAKDGPKCLSALGRELGAVIEFIDEAGLPKRASNESSLEVKRACQFPEGG